MNQNNNSIQHLSIIIDYLKNKTNFAIIRPGDGEYFIMINKHFSTQDNWKFDGGILQKDLLDIKDLKKGLANFFIGIPCQDCQGPERVTWYKNTWELEDTQITYANIFCNKNWPVFTQYLIDSKIPLYYIGPGHKLDSELNIKDIFNVDEYLVNNWDTQKSTFLDNIDTWVCNINNNSNSNTFMFSAGPISKYIIPILYKKYPNNQFIDVGSSLDIFMKGNTNRGYIHSNQSYSNIVCSFNSGHNYKN